MADIIEDQDIAEETGEPMVDRNILNEVEGSLNIFLKMNECLECIDFLDLYGKLLKGIETDNLNGKYDELDELKIAQFMERLGGLNKALSNKLKHISNIR